MQGPDRQTTDTAQTPFVDRIEERRLLRSRFEQAAEGEGQVVLLTGEAGIGKSRLAQTVREAVAEIPHLWLEAGASPRFVDTPFHAWSALLGELVGAADARPAARAEALAAALARAGLDPARTLPQVAPLLGFTVPEGFRPELAAPEVARRRLLGTLTTWVFGLTQIHPVVILLEDLHWADPSTLELQQLLVEQGATARLLLLYTARPEFSVPWPDRAHFTQLTVNRLRRSHVREMVAGVAARSTLLADVVDQVVARTDGVPLFVEELTKGILEVGRAAAARELPRSLADSLLARIERLGESAKQVAQAAAVCGREFRYDLLQAVHPLGDEALQSALQKLVRAELLYLRGFPPDATYTFKHALVQDSAYGSLPEHRRRALHGQVAAALRTRYAALAEDHPAVLAQHHAEAGEHEAAVGAWQRAGEQALHRGALSEADVHLRLALDLLARLPDEPARAARELRVQLMLCSLLQLRRGYAAPETAAALARARAIGEHMADPDQLGGLLVGACLLTLVREGPAVALPVADQLVTMARPSGSAGWRAWAHLGRGLVSFFAGEYATADEHLAQSCQGAATLPYVVPVDHTILATGYRMYTAWHFGRAAEAQRLAAELPDRAEASGRAVDRAWAHQFRTTYYATMVGDFTAAEAAADVALSACAEEANPTQELAVRIVLGWVRTQQGQLEVGLAMMRSALDRFVDTGQRLRLGLYLGLLVDVHARAGHIAEALRVLEDSESACPSEACLRPTQLCQRADLLARAGASAADVDLAYREALTCARDQGSQALQLRVALGHARWLRARGANAEARALLAPLSARLEEDDDSRDAREARATLGELASMLAA